MTLRDGKEINSLPIMTDDKIAKFYFNEFWKSLNPDDILIKPRLSIVESRSNINLSTNISKNIKLKDF